MKPTCTDAIQAAAGRALSKAELDGIEERITSALRDASQKDHAKFMSMAPADRLVEAAKTAKEWMLQDVVRAHESAIVEAGRKAALQAELDGVKPGLNGQLAALKNKIMKVENQVNALSNGFFSQLRGLNEADGGRFFGLFQDPAKQKDISAALFGEQSSPEAAAAAKSIKAMMDSVANRFQSAGLALNKREDYRTPQPQDPRRVAGNKAQWIDDHMNWVDRKAYVNPDGTLMKDDQLRAMLERSWRTIATDGANKRAEGEGGYGGHLVGGNKNAPRQLFFKNSDAWTQAMQKYGRTTNMYELIGTHVKSMSRDIVNAETFGRNMEANVTQARNRAYVKDQEALTTDKQRNSLDSMNAKTERLYNAYLFPERMGNETFANWMVNLRGLMASTQLGSMVGALPDLAGMKMAAEHSGLPQLRMFSDMLRNVFAGKEQKEFLANLGVWNEGFQHMQHRMVDGGLQNGWGSWLNELTHKAMGLNAFDRGMRAANGLAVMRILGKFTREHDTLAGAEGEARLLQDNGITQDHWNVWKLAELEGGPSGSDGLLTHANIYNIPDAKLDPLVEQRVAKRSETFQQEIDKRNERTAQEQSWVQGRREKLAAARDKANKFLRELTERRQGKVDAYSEAADARAEVLKARIEQAEVEHDIAAYLKTETAQGKVRDFLYAVEDGASIERKTIRERVHPDRMPDAVVEVTAKTPGVGEKADRVVENYGRSINKAAETLGARRAQAEARIKEAEQRVADQQKTLDADALRRAGELDKRFQPRVKELQDFTKEMQERATKRAEYADAFQKKLGNVLEEERMRLKDEAAEKLLETTYGQMRFGARGASESNTADKVAMGLDHAQAGTIMGELLRFGLQFKSVPIGVLRTHWEKMQQLDTWGSKASYSARFVGYSALMGAIALEAKSLMNGQDPRSMNIMTEEGRKFWMEAAASGGGFGLYGDLFVNGSTKWGSGAEALAGPGISAGFTLLRELNTAREEASAGATEHPYALSGLRFVRQNATPLMNLWYTKAAFNRLVYDNLQDTLSPGASDKMRRRSEQRGVSYYWAPGTNAPQKAPDFGKLAE